MLSKDCLPVSSTKLKAGAGWCYCCCCFTSINVGVIIKINKHSVSGVQLLKVTFPFFLVVFLSTTSPPSLIRSVAPPLLWSKIKGQLNNMSGQKEDMLFDFMRDVSPFLHLPTNVVTGGGRPLLYLKLHVNNHSSHITRCAVPIVNNRTYVVTFYCVVLIDVVTSTY